MEPLDAVEVKLPGVMAMLVAPVALQLSVLPVPAFTLAGLAAKDPIAGNPPFMDEPDEFPPQPACPAQASTIKIAHE
jgi:hypothetical protein